MSSKFRRPRGFLRETAIIKMGMDEAECWLERLAAGDATAAESLWKYFFERLRSYAETCLRKLPPNVGDADDIVASVFKSICRMIESRSIPRIQDREQLWPLLATIAARKVGKIVRRNRPNQLGRQLLESDLDALDVGEEETPILSSIIGREPSPDFVASIQDLLTQMEARLDVADRTQYKERIIAELWLAGYSLAEMSESQRIPLRTVARKLNKIRRLLREFGDETLQD